MFLHNLGLLENAESHTKSCQENKKESHEATRPDFLQLQKPPWCNSTSNYGNCMCTINMDGEDVLVFVANG